jgi:hypothetical protein
MANPVRTLRWRWLPLAGGLALVGAGPVVAGPVVAGSTAAEKEHLGATHGLVYTAMPAGVDENETGSPVANCPKKAAVTGGGFLTGAGNLGEANVSTALPYDDADANEIPDDGFKSVLTNLLDDGRLVESHAVCKRAGWGNGKGTPSLGSAKGLRYVYGTAGISATSAGHAIASCPKKMSVTGGGGTLSGPAAEMFLNSSSPIDLDDEGAVPDDGWEVYGYNGDTVLHAITAYAVCTKGAGNGSKSAAKTTLGSAHGLTYVRQTVDVDPIGIGTAGCPGPTSITGGGGFLTGASAEARLISSISLDGGDPHKVPDDLWYATAQNLNAPGKMLRVFAICR